MSIQKVTQGFGLPEHFTSIPRLQEIRFTSTAFARPFNVCDTNFAMKCGGGVDLRVHPRLGVRLTEYSRNLIFRGDRTLDDEVFGGRTRHDFTIGFGIAIH